MERTSLTLLMLVAVMCVQGRSEPDQQPEDSLQSPSQDSRLRFISKQDRKYNSMSSAESTPVNCGHGNYCPANHTCCRGHSGYWACCPLPKATCCPDGVHCCPSGYHCSMITRKCQKSNWDVISMTKKVSAFKIETEKEVSGQKEKAMIEDARREVISMGKNGRPLRVVVPDQNAKKRLYEDLNAPIYCDKSHVCPPGHTCCRQHTGSWGCCPRLSATCCQDGLHCCPYGYRCSVVTNKCYRGDNDVIPIFKKTPALKQSTVDESQTNLLNKQQNSLRNNPDNKLQNKLIEHLKVPASTLMPEVLPQQTYCNGSHYCPDHYTCCHSRFGHWTCCPGIQATCCYDGVHCCPRYLRCDVINNRCVKDDVSASEWKYTGLQPVDEH